MNISTSLVLTSIGLKTGFDLLQTSTNIISSTTKVFSNMHKEHTYELKPVEEKLDLIFKLQTIKIVCNELEKDNRLIFIIDGIREIVDKINNLCEKMKERIDYNKRIWFYLNKSYLDDLIIELEKQHSILEKRFNFLLSISTSIH